MSASLAAVGRSSRLCRCEAVVCLHSTVRHFDGLFQCFFFRNAPELVPLKNNLVILLKELFYYFILI